MGKAGLPKKPNNATWTDEQWQAIMSSGEDILVAAAAGSGKTAVLVERIIKKILAEKNHVNVDELLIVTFTNAAAAEMRQRIGEALEKAMNDHPESNRLRMQLSLLNKATISTIHSFCLDVIRKYYYVIDIDPGFRIADDAEAGLLREEALDQLLEEEYGKDNNDSFYKLVDAFTGDRNDRALQELILQLYDFARANPNPHDYLRSIIAMYDVNEHTDIDELPFMQTLRDDIALQLDGARNLLFHALELTKLPGGPAPLADNFMEDMQIVDALIAGKNIWNTLYEAMQSWAFSRAKPCKGDEMDQELVNKAKKYREKAKKILQTLREELFSRKPESFLRDMQKMKSQMEVLVRLVADFSQSFQQMKTEKGLVDFADLEHFCLAILSENGDHRHPSEAALSYQTHFKEVLIDEYQDVNMVQESIIRLVAKQNTEADNLFMVGDVKQSIYRFRLAEPNLFLGKYRAFSSEGNDTGLKIDLARNFRSRKEILDGTNFVFKQIMDEKIGEIDYNPAAELVKGAAYPEDQPYPVELFLIDQKREEAEEKEEPGFDRSDLEQSQLESRVIADKINALIAGRAEVYEAKIQACRTIKYRDIVILLRSMTWAPEMIEELKKQGIPVYANLATGYFAATEVAIMLSLLKIIDNPFQDIPLAAVLRSPIVGLNEEELAKLRIYQKKGAFFEAMTAFCKESPAEQMEGIYRKVYPFYQLLQDWRVCARQGALSALIWQIYQDTRFYDFVGGIPGGKQRQANLRALYDRARQYEETSFRGLFRFLRFIERMRDRGDDLGAARALGEQEDVVRIMTIHSSKGLEFPVVFLAGLGRSFNMLDLNKPYILDKEYGLASKFVDVDKRMILPSLPQLSLKRKKKYEMIAEEMRVLYVAFTRAKEKLYFTASVKNLEKKSENWSQSLEESDWLLPAYERANAKSYLDWIAPALRRHKDWHDDGAESGLSVSAEIAAHPSSWKINLLTADEVQRIENKEAEKEEDYLENVYRGEEVLTQSSYKQAINRQLSWQYPFKDASVHRSKQSVTELKRQHETVDERSGTDLQGLRKPVFNRPRFMQEKALTPAEAGTAMHMAMLHVDLTKEVSIENVNQLLASLVEKELLTEEQKNSINGQLIVQFYQTELGKRLSRAINVKREVPFSLSIPASEAYGSWHDKEEQVLVQGIIDCLFEDEQGLVLVDYKTDRVNGRFKGGFAAAKPILTSRYQMQIDLYTEAIAKIYKRKVAERYLFFFDCAGLIRL
ncbi:helicase-exonuclease AddAB subunit AddA [Bacillaceae bacterium Marseille-Q3522]|nr:helicase-exonuclease AddAB subunit AddA [Bacillaceae bacterium Marseille-Q3522]